MAKTRRNGSVKKSDYQKENKYYVIQRAGSLDWKGGDGNYIIAKTGLDVLVRIGDHVAGQIQKNLSKPARNGRPSKRGEFPRMRTGTLRDGINSWVTADELSLYVGSSLPPGTEPYNIELEFSKRRSFMMRTIKEEIPTIVRLFKDMRRMFPKHFAKFANQV